MTTAEIDAVKEALLDIVAAEERLFHAAERLSHLKDWKPVYNSVCRKGEMVHDLYGRVRDALKEEESR